MSQDPGRLLFPMSELVWMDVLWLADCLPKYTGGIFYGASPSCLFLRELPQSLRPLDSSQPFAVPFHSTAVPSVPTQRHCRAIGEKDDDVPRAMLVDRLKDIHL